MRIKFDNINPYIFEKRYIFDKTRYDTLTDCHIINNNLLICANRQAALIYLVYFSLDKNEYKILDQCESIINNEPIHIELFKEINGYYYATSYTNKLLLFTVCDQKIKIIKSINLDANCLYHGLCTSNNFIYVTNSHYEPDGLLTKYDIINDSYINIRIKECKNLRIKDMYIDCINNHYLLLTTSSGPDDKYVFYDSEIFLYSLVDNNFIFLDSYKLLNTHVDSIILNKNNYYITSQSIDKSCILKFIIDNNKFKLITKIDIENYPHGISSYENILAYTSYGNCSVIINLIEHM